MLAKGVWIYVQIILVVVSIITGLGVFQAALNAHNTLALLGGLLTLLGLPPLVAFFSKLVFDQLN